MVSTFTPNIQWEEPARGDDVGTWDVPINSNGTLIDLVVGANTAIAATGNITLSAAQFRSATLTFNSTLPSNITITFPTSFTKPYNILHTATGSSAFTISLATTAAGGQVVAVPPGQGVSVINDGSNIKFIGGLLPIGAYWDYAGSSTPNWNDACTVPPYVACIGGSLSSATYPLLFNLIGGTLPDSRARARLALDAGTNRVTAGIGGFNGNALFAAGGDQNVHAHSHGVTDPGHVHAIDSQGTGSPGNGLQFMQGSGTTGSVNSHSAQTGISINSFGSGASQNMQPSYVGGITMIRAA